MNHDNIYDMRDLKISYVGMKQLVNIFIKYEDFWGYF